MSFGDENLCPPAPEDLPIGRPAVNFDLGKPARPTHVLYRCRRCGSDVVLEQPNPLIHVREAIEHRALVRLHDCADGAHGVADLIGSGPGRPFAGRL